MLTGPFPTSTILGVTSGLSASQPVNAVEMWERRVSESGSKTAFRYKREGAWVSRTWLEADGDVREVAAGLRAMGIVPGDRVGILSQTRYEWLLCDVATSFCGAVTVPIYASNTAEQCAFIVRDAGARILIVEDASQLEKVCSVRDQLPADLRFICIAGDVELETADARGRTRVGVADVTKASGAQVTALAEVVAGGVGRASDLSITGAGAAPESMFTIIYTSGTTGTPKGVVLSHLNLTAAMASACRTMALFPNDEQLLFLPMAHVLGREMAWVGVEAGLVTSFAESIGKLKRNLAEIRPTFMAGVPRVFEKFHAGVLAALTQGSPIKRRLMAWAVGVGRRSTEAAAAGRRSLGFPLSLERALADKLVFSKLRAKLGLDRCRFLISGGAPLAKEICEFFRGAGILILEGYGLTETVGAAFLNRPDRVRFGTVGVPLDVVEMRIAADGEILMRGPSVFQQYYRDAAATAEAVDPDGWYHSGDIGELEDGFLRITDRKKDLIVTAGGKKIAPQPLESAIKSRSSLISQAVVYGDRRPYCVVLLTPSDEALKRFGDGQGGVISDAAGLRAEIQKTLDDLNVGLAPYETIKKFFMTSRDFSEADGEMTPSLKVKRKIVIEKYREEIEALYRGGHAPD